MLIIYRSKYIALLGLAFIALTLAQDMATFTKSDSEAYEKLAIDTLKDFSISQEGYYAIALLKMLGSKKADATVYFIVYYYL